MDVNFPKIEEEVLEKWKREKTFEKSVQKRKKGRRFVFYEGPPTANGKPGIHHVMGRVFKDIILRYKTMRGFFVPRRAGWDTHGLPVELQIEKKLGLKSKKDIEQYGIAKFNQECKQSVWEFKKDWEALTERIGFWLDMEDTYITYETSYIETLWSIIKQFWNKKLLYKDYKVVPWCTRCGTVLSSHELAQGYQTDTEQSVFVKFKLKSRQKIGEKFTTDDNTYILSWTTTPWTLPGNVALAVGENIEYEIEEFSEYDEQRGEKSVEVVENLIFARELKDKIISQYADDIVNHKIKKNTTRGWIQGKNLIGLEYEPLFDIKALQNEKSHKVYAADFVTTTEGTGIVHTAVMYGEDDYALGKKIGLPQHHTVDEQGKFTNEVVGFEELSVVSGQEKNKETEEKIFSYLKEKGNFFAIQAYSHEYPHCWRCSTPLLYYAKDCWFVGAGKVKQQLIKNNQSIYWIPSHIKNGRMGEWLKEGRDWAFSRERYWGTPLPVWQCLKCKHIDAIGSVKELSKKQKSTNSFFIMRHGYSERQITKTMSCWPEKTPLPLTRKGIQQVLKSAKELGRKKIDLVFSSDLLRAKQTAEIVGTELGVEPIFDERLREWNVGELNGQPIEKVGEVWGKLDETSEEHYLRRFVDPMPGGESCADLQRRMYDFIKEANGKYENKNILIVSHEMPLTLLETTMRGMGRKEAVEFRQSKKRFLNTAEWRKLPSFVNLPFDEGMEINLHKPYVDEVELVCGECEGIMKRVKEVVDVWFDSGAMPFASKSPFPADYIVEGIDQTRGWFYTLLAVSTLLGLGAPYKNAIALSHVLDEKGEKMSKSKGNVVDPWAVIQKYGIDAVRWYFYTVNNPGETKLFSEKDIQETIRRFLLTFWNCFVFYETYATKHPTSNIPAFAKATAGKQNPKHVLDRWVLSRLNGIIQEITKKLDAYDITGAARAIENFVVNDLSLWYIRRSRQRFKEASPTLGFVLATVCKLAAPFIPFLSERMFQEITGLKSSVHWENFPKYNGKLANKKLEEQMIWARDIVAKALAERAKLGIKVRQPLASLNIQHPTSNIQNDILNLIKDEVNVKEILFKAGLQTDIELDAKITSELKEEGIVREIVRSIQGMRKDAGYTPSDKILLTYSGDEDLCDLLLANEYFLKKSAGIKTFIRKEQNEPVDEIKKDITVDGKTLTLSIVKTR